MLRFWGSRINWDGQSVQPAGMSIRSVLVTRPKVTRLELTHRADECLPRGGYGLGATIWASRASNGV
jgi:hypothetical protein